MADQDVEYRVKLDTSDLASQLQSVRAQIDQAMAAQTFSSVIPTAQSSAFAFPFSSIFSNASSTAVADANNAIAAGSRGFSNLGGLANATRLGFQRFNNDVMTAYLSQTGAPLFTNSDGTPIPSFANRGIFANVLTATLGFGHDPTMPITPGEFERRAGYEIARQSTNLLMGGIGGAVGTAWGTSLAGPWGGVAGGILGTMVGDMAYDASAATILRDYEQTSRIRDFAYNTSWRTYAGRFTRAQALEVGTGLATIARSQPLVGYGVTNDDATRMIQEFTAIGGFDTVRSADEYQERARSVIENNRKVMQVLRLTEEEALRYIKEMQINNMGNNLGANSIGVATIAYASGYTPKEFLTFAQQSAELIRGTGISMASAFTGGMDSLLRTRAELQQGTLSPELIRQYGGVENYTMNINRMGYEWAQSTSGFTQFAAASAMGGGLGRTVGMDPTHAIGAAVGYLTGMGLEGMLGFQGSIPRIVSNYSPTYLAAWSGLQTAEEMHMAGMPVSEDTFIGREMLRGVSYTDALSKYRTMWGAGQVDIERLRRQGYQTVTDAVPTKWNIMLDRVSNAISNTVGNIGAPLTPTLRGIEAVVESYFGRPAEPPISSMSASVREGLTTWQQMPDYVRSERDARRRVFLQLSSHPGFGAQELYVPDDETVTDPRTGKTRVIKATDNLERMKELALETYAVDRDINLQLMNSRQNADDALAAGGVGGITGWLGWSANSLATRVRGAMTAFGANVVNMWHTFTTGDKNQLLPTVGGNFDIIQQNTIRKTGEEAVDSSLTVAAQSNANLSAITERLRQMGATPGMSRVMSNDPQVAVSMMTAEANLMAQAEMNKGIQKIASAIVDSDGTPAMRTK
jgi:hypothetical protein